MQVEVSTLIAAPPRLVFATLTDVEQWPRFVRAVEGAELLTSGPVAVGTRFRQTRKVHGRLSSEEMTVARLEPPHRFDLTAENHGARYFAIHEILADGEGSRLVLRFGAEPHSLAAKLFSLVGGLFVGVIRDQLKRDVEDVRLEAERRRAA